MSDTQEPTRNNTRIIGWYAIVAVASTVVGAVVYLGWAQLFTTHAFGVISDTATSATVNITGGGWQLYMAAACIAAAVCAVGAAFLVSATGDATTTPRQAVSVVAVAALLGAGVVGALYADGAANRAGPDAVAAAVEVWGVATGTDVLALRDGTYVLASDTSCGVDGQRHGHVVELAVTCS